VKTLWELPVPSTAILGSGPRFEKRQGRVCALVFDIEEKDDQTASIQIVFTGVEAFKCTYFNACEVDALKAYDKLVDRGRTEWLANVEHNLTRMADAASGLAHLMIYFDDGPCYEFVCRGFEIKRNVPQ
jgi:hypothetical protein